jgi:tetratricopeptide (TPR) repeat protein
MPSNDRKQELERARDLSTDRQWDDAYLIADRWLTENPDDVQFLVVMTHIMLGAGKTTVAYHLAKRATELAPKECGVWMNAGMASNDLWRTKEARRYYERGLKLAKTDSQRSMMCVNIASVLIDTGRFTEAEPYCEMSVRYNPKSIKGWANLGFSQLAQRKWVEGWKNYRYAIGTEFRPSHTYAEEPMWDGIGRGVIALTSEQGIGDVVSFASMVPDAIEWAKNNDSQIYIDCEPRMHGVLSRSFPEAKVYPTLLADEVVWDAAPDYSIVLGQLGEYFRLDDESFTGEPYLKPCPDRLLQWQALFESKNKPVIGLAWRGGIPRTGARFRQWDLEQLLPILESVDAHWVSLQYKPAGREIAEFRKRHPKIDLVEYPHLSLSNDYDDTIAGVAAMDHIITMQTAVNHVAGAVGTPAWVHVPNNSQWRYGEKGEDFPWAKSVRIIRQKTRGEWADTIEQTAEELNAHFTGLSAGNGKTKRRGKFRQRRKNVRHNNQQYRSEGRDNASA